MLARSSRTSWTALVRWVRYNGSKPTATSPQKADEDNIAPVVLSEADIASMVIPGRALNPPTTIHRTHAIPVAEVHFLSRHHYPLDLFAHFAGHVASALGIPATRPIPLPTQRSMWTVLRGPFVHKKSQENFERRVHKRVIKAWDAELLIPRQLYSILGSLSRSEEISLSFTTISGSALKYAKPIQIT
ncbi:ribosomal protein S10 domain-containing protein [Boletus coccyginus]|nr:ribosomal protein S10 domain-containing protein [Boletus coccyginus]